MSTANSYGFSLSRLLSPVFLDALANNDEYNMKSIASQLTKSGFIHNVHTTFRDAIDQCYSYLYDNYKNEYVYKNIIFQKLVMKNHTFADCVAIPEFRVGLSKADLAVFNGTSTVYEIKTELDSAARLASQLADYLKFFDFIYIVTHAGFVKTAEKMSPQHVGIYILDENGEFQVHREASSNKVNVSHESLMASLRKPEYTSIIQSEYGYIPDVPNTKYYRECETLFKALDIVKAHDNVVTALLSRRIQQNQIDMIESFPESLKSLSLTKRYSKRECENIIQNLQLKLIF